MHEKLSDIDDALQWFQLYTTMNLTAPERDRADAYIRRLEGAKKELAQRPAGRPAGSTSAPPRPSPDALSSSLVLAPPVPARGSGGHGRVDAATITAISVAGAALAFGTVMAVKAASDKPPSSFVTGENGSYDDLAGAASSAHREAIFADVGFGVSLAAGITAAVLYFARPPGGVSASPQAAPATPSVSAAPLAGGAAILVQGSM